LLCSLFRQSSSVQPAKQGRDRRGRKRRGRRERKRRERRGRKKKGGRRRKKREKRGRRRSSVVFSWIKLSALYLALRKRQ
jgi:hypothetical protein